MVILSDAVYNLYGMNARGAPDCKPVKHGLKDFGGEILFSQLF